MVSVTSITVAVFLWYVSYLVGVVMVVCRLFSIRNMCILWLSLSRLLFMSPCIVIVVFGWFVCILSITSCRLFMRSDSLCGLL